MRLIKCPRCELNYIEEGEGYCKICKREMKGEGSREENELCSICNERPVMPGKDVCYYCYKDMSGEEPSQEEGDGPVAVEVGIDPVSSMDEIVSDTETDDIPEGEFQEIESEMSLDEMGEEEENEDDEEDDE